MFVMLLFIYPNTSLYGYRVITVLYDLQIFAYPTNNGLTCVHCSTASEMRASGTLATFGTILHRLKASDTETTFGAIFQCPEGSPPCHQLLPVKYVKVYHR
jgi:hypothetical protein